MCNLSCNLSVSACPTPAWCLPTQEEVSKHASRTDAWIIVTDKKTKVDLVYDISEYVDQHPGGESILNNVGRDATEGVYGPQHPVTVFQLLEDMVIGRLKS